MWDTHVTCSLQKNTEPWRSFICEQRSSIIYQSLKKFHNQIPNLSSARATILITRKVSQTGHSSEHVPFPAYFSKFLVIRTDYAECDEIPQKNIVEWGANLQDVVTYNYDMIISNWLSTMAFLIFQWPRQTLILSPTLLPLNPSFLNNRQRPTLSLCTILNVCICIYIPTINQKNQTHLLRKTYPSLYLSS